MKRLPQELRTGQAPVNPNAGAAFFGDWRNAGELLHFGGEFETPAVGAKSGQEPRSQGSSRAREAAKQGRVVMLIEQGGNLLVVLLDRFGEQRDLCDQGVNLHRSGQQDGPILSQRLSFLDVGHQLLEFVFSTIPLNLIELANRGRRGLLQLLERWPALKKSASASGVQVTKPLQRLRKEHLQRRRQLVRQSGSFVHQMPPVFGQQLNAAGQNIIGNPDAQMLAMSHQDLQQQVGIAGIILGPAGMKRLSELRQRLRVDRIEAQKIDMHQRIDQRSAFLFDSDGDGPSGKSLPQLLDPALQGLRRLIQTEALLLVSVGFLQRHSMFLVGPIQSNKCNDLNIRFRHLQTSPSFFWLKTTRQEVPIILIAESLKGQHLSIRSTSRADRARKSPLTVEAVGWTIRNATRPVFHKGNSFTKENGLWKMPQLWTSAKQSVGLRPPFVDTDARSCLESLEKREAFPHLPQALLPFINMEQTFILKTIRGGCAVK